MKTAFVIADLLKKSLCARFASNFCAHARVLLALGDALQTSLGIRGPELKPNPLYGLLRFGTAAVTMRSFTMALIVKDYAHKELAEDDLQGIYDFIADAEIVAGPDELYTIVSELWPELLHKVKPPRSLMH